MFLNYGVDQYGESVYISEVDAGKTELVCPFCQALLVAKKGNVLEHHFAHLGPTCNDSKQTLSQTGVPFFDYQSGLPNYQMSLLLKLNRWRTFSRHWLTSRQKLVYDSFLDSGLLLPAENVKPFKLSDEADALVKLNQGYMRCRGLLSHAQLQEALFRIRLKMLTYIDLDTGSNTATFYKQRLSSYLKQHLYVISVKLEFSDVSYPLLKIGMTRRKVTERVAEINTELSKYGTVIEIKVLGYYEHYGALERVMLQMLSDHRFKFGTHQEYFYAITANSLIERCMLDSLGRRIVNEHEVKVLYRDHKAKVKAGQARQKLLNNRHLGRKLKSNQELLNDHQDIVSAFGAGLSLRNANELTGKSINTIRKVYDLIKRTR
ncbi:GIY-YIG nuclease family protein [Vibrio parahaemolyticus]|uniref:GIY-YIG nuclease family protein n=1 Tax=Vibrio parahaemolyticus TaxID=670 RepID=UPI0012B95A70|nr:GIY-YIG nuclease family protein [Vibrio parahaemolyticus]TMX80328.1 hypothetical protein DA094_02000 [Vibrio parahaemolyticus]